MNDIIQSINQLSSIKKTNAMRKSFTRLISIFMLLCGLSFQMAYGITFDGTKSVPTDGNLNAKPADFATKFVVAFDAVPTISTGTQHTFVIYKNSALFKTIPMNSSAVVVNGKTIEVTHGLSSFTYGDAYELVITDGSITGLAAGAMTFGSATGFNFTVGDYVKPMLSTTAAAFTPSLGATSVDASAPFTLTITFNEKVEVPATPGDKAVYVYKADGTIVDIVKVSTLTIAPGGATTVNVPLATTSIFSELTSYYVVIDAGAFVDSQGNLNPFDGLSNTSTWTFTTRDDTPPVITASVSDITTSAANLNVSLSEKGKYYYLLQTQATADPLTAAAVKAAGTVVSVTSANTVVTSALVVAGSTDYEVFVVAENNEAVSPDLTTTFTKINFSSIDNTPPTLLAKGELANADKKTYALYMVFNEQVVGNTGDLDLRLWSDESYVKTIGAASITSTKVTTAAQVTKYSGAALNDWVVELDLGMTLPSKTNYYVTCYASLIKDMSDNAWAGAGSATGNAYVNKGDWAFTSSDFELPTVTVAFATPSSLASDITVTFNETIQKQIKTPATTDWADVLALEVDNVAVPFTVTSPAGAANGTVITIDPTPAALASNTTYVVKLRPDAVMDLNGNAIVTENEYPLTTGDLDVFTVAYGSSLGASTTTNLLATSTFKIDFNKAIQVNTGTAWVAATASNLTSLITVKKGATTKAATITYDASTFTIDIDVAGDLVSNASDYTVTIDGTKIRDSQSTVLSTVGGYAATTTYTVKDYEKPVVTLSHEGNVANTTPAPAFTITLTDDNIGTLVSSDGSGISVNNIVFKENNESGANLGFAITYAVVGTSGTITITPTVPLATGKTYYYGVGESIKDGTGNITDGKFAAFTMVAPTNPPVITADTYTANGSSAAVGTKVNNIVGVSNKVTVVVEFNDNVKEVTASTNVNLTDGTTTWTDAVTSAEVSGNILTLVFDLTSPTIGSANALASDTECSIVLPASLVQGSSYISGTNTFAQFAGATIKFDSKDVVNPTVVSHTPTGTGIALNTAITLNLSEKVVLGTGNITIKEGTTTVQTIPVSTNVSLDATGTVATITKTGDLPKYNTAYTINIPTTAFTDDVSLNPLSGAYTGTFTTVVNPQPAIASFTANVSPADGSDRVPLSPLTLTMTFTEDVVKYDPTAILTQKGWWLMERTGAAPVATFSGDNLVTGVDVVAAKGYIEESNVGITNNVVSIETGFTPVAGKYYYVMVNQGSFLDKSLGTSSLPANPVPGVFAGVTTNTAWEFTTKDENQGTVTFAYTKLGDNLVATTSDIVITFSRPIVKSSGAAINDVDIATLFTLTKNWGLGTTGTKAFIGTISADKTIVTILNSSLVTLGEMTKSSNFTITGAGIKYANGSAVSGASDTFTTSNYLNPVVTSIVHPTSATTDITETKAKFNFVCNATAPTPAGAVPTPLSKVYYTIKQGSTVDASVTAAIIMSGSSQTLTGTTDTKTFEFTGLTEETNYVVYSVCEDVAGNVSAIKTTTFVTDDVTTPKLVASANPTSFDSAGKLTFTFDEAVNPGAGVIKVIDKETTKLLAALTFVNHATDSKKLVTTAFAGMSTANDLTDYIIEIEAGAAEDIAVNGEPTNKFEGLYGLISPVYVVTSVDQTNPVITGSTPSINPAGTTVLPVSTNEFTLHFTEPVKKTSTILTDAVVFERYNTTTSAWEEFQVVEASNIITNGTSDVKIIVSRAFDSSIKYRVTVKANSFEDMGGYDELSGISSATTVFTTADEASPIVATYNPTGSNIASGGTTLTITYSEAIRLLDNTAIDSYDLDSLVYVKKNDVNIDFYAVMSTSTVANDQITITIPATANDQTYEYGFKAKFEDAFNNAVGAGSTTFSTTVTNPASIYLTWTPDNNVAAATPLGIDQAITLEFTGEIFTYDTNPTYNNLPVTPTYLGNDALIVTNSSGVIAPANLVFTISADSKTVTVAPKAGTTWGSSETITVTVKKDELQIGEGAGTTILTGAAIFDSNNYAVEDVIAPTVLTYTPAKVGSAAASSPFVAKTGTLSFTMSEAVVASTGKVVIYSWDGEIRKSVDVVVTGGTTVTTVANALLDLATNEEYYAIIETGTVKDVTDGNAYESNLGVKEWRFTITDDATPVATYAPTTGNQPVTTNLTVVFDRPVQFPTALPGGYVAIYESAAGGDAVQIFRGADNATTSAFSLSTDGLTLTIDIADLAQDTEYFVEIPEGVVVSAADPTIKQTAISRTVWSFTTEVNKVPTILATGYSPAMNATDVDLNSDLMITFDMEVEAGSGIIQLHKADGSQILDFPVNGADVTFEAGGIVKVALPTLAENSQYYVIIPATAIRNTTYTPEYFAGIIVPYVWKFNTVVDATMPTVMADVTSGTEMTTNTFDIVLTFDETVTGAMTGITTTGATSAVVTETTAGTVYTVSVTADDLATVVITADATIADLAGNALAETTFTYPVADNNGPTLAVDVADGSTVATNMFDVVLTFNEDVTGVDAAVSVSAGTVTVTGSGSVYTASITAPSTTDVVLTVANTVVDLASNAFAGATYTYNVTGDTDAPVVTGLTPANGASLADAHPAELVMTFDEDVVAGAGTLSIYNGATVEWSFDITDSAVSIDGNEVTITLANSLDKNTTYFVYVDAGFVTDAYDNAYAGISSPTAWTFTTGDFKTGIDPVIGSLELKVYPNPLQDGSVLRISNATELSRIVITSMTGQKVKEIVSPSEAVINGSELRSGVYFVSMYVDGVVAKTERIVKR